MEVGLACTTTPVRCGMFARGVASFGFQDITDGTSNTILMGETKADFQSSVLSGLGMYRRPCSRSNSTVLF